MAHHGPHWLDREDIGDLTVVRFAVTRLWEEQTNRAIFQLLTGLVEVGRRQLLLNLGRVEYLTSDAISGLVMLNRKVGAAQGRLVLSDLSDAVGQVFRTMHLSGVFEIFATEAQALPSFRLVERKTVGDVVVLTVRPVSLDEQDILSLFEELHRLVEERDCGKLVLDFHRVTALPGPFLAELPRLIAENVEAVGGRLAVCGLNPDLYAEVGRPDLPLHAEEVLALDSLADGA
jgi:anti-anti-sigma factor